MALSKRMFVAVICTALFMGGCGVVASSSTPPLVDQDSLRQSSTINEKLIHRFEQRGFVVDSSELPTDGEQQEEPVEEKQEKTAAEKMAEQGQWTIVGLTFDDKARAMFNDQTLHYFEEDLYENYPPPKKNMIDAIATVIYENDAGFILDGLLRNGHDKQSFTLEQLKPLQLRLVTANNHAWIITTLEKVEGLQGIKNGEAVPFRLVISKAEEMIPEFDYGQFNYHAVLQQPKKEEKEVKSEDKKKEEEKNEKAKNEKDKSAKENNK